MHGLKLILVEYTIVTRLQDNPLDSHWFFQSLGWTVLSSRGKWHGTSYKQIYFTQGCFEPSLVEIGPLILQRNWPIKIVTCFEFEDSGRSIIKTMIEKIIKYKTVIKQINIMIEIIQTGTSQYIQLFSLRINYP